MCDRRIGSALVRQHCSRNRTASTSGFINEIDEPVSVAGLDADPGATNYVFTGGPGTMELMCWPFSDHSTGVEPNRLRLQIVDPPRVARER